MRMKAGSASGRLAAAEAAPSPGAPPTLPPLGVRAHDLAIFYHLEGVGERWLFGPIGVCGAVGVRVTAPCARQGNDSPGAG